MNEKRNPYLIIADPNHHLFAEKKKRDLTRKSIRCEIHIMNHSDEWKEIEKILTEQSLGTLVTIFANHATSQQIKQKAISAGFSRDSILIETSSQQTYLIFCSQCQVINQKSEFKRFSCQKCSQLLEPTDHYSEYHRAYLGFPII